MEILKVLVTSVTVIIVTVLIITTVRSMFKDYLKSKVVEVKPVVEQVKPQPLIVTSPAVVSVSDSNVDDTKKKQKEYIPFGDILSTLDKAFYSDEGLTSKSKENNL